MVFACAIGRKNFARMGEAVGVFVHLSSESFDERT